MKPKGILIAIGGNEEREFDQDERYYSDFKEGGGILQTIIDYAGGPQARVEVVTTASSVPEQVGATYLQAFGSLNALNVGILDIRDTAQANTPEVIERISVASAVMFSGGDQSRLAAILHDSALYRQIRERFLNDNFVVAGTSAGAMAMSEEMITGGKHEKLLMRSALMMGKGLGLMNDIIFDSHFIQRGRFGRLAEAVALHPHKLGVGLGEDTGMVISEGEVCEVIGSGMVILFDGHEFSYNRCDQLNEGIPISLGNLVVHILAPYDRYYLKDKRIEIFQHPEFYKEVSR